MSGATSDDRPTLVEVLPKAGLVYSEKGNLSEVLCKISCHVSDIIYIID